MKSIVYTASEFRVIQP